MLLPFLKVKRIEKLEKICLSDRKTFTKNSRYCAAVGFARGVAQLLNSPSTAALLLLILARDPAHLLQHVAGVGAAGSWLPRVIKCPLDATSVDSDPHYKKSATVSRISLKFFDK